MKKTLLLLASAALLLVGCAKEQVAEKATGEGLQTFSFTVGVESAVTKAVADNDGKAAKINHWVIQVIDSDNAVYHYKAEDGVVGEKTHTFDVSLIKGQTYDVLFWADTKGAYNIEDLTNVSKACYTANADSLDAFYAVVSGFSTTQSTKQDITLKRPFAQLNVVFTDLEKLYTTIGNDDEYEKFVPKEFVAKAKVPASFDVRSQTAGAADTVITVKAATDYNGNYVAKKDTSTLYMDYMFASKDTKDVVDIDFSFVSKGVTIAHNFTSIPFQRNYRTNIKGDLMSANAKWEVEVDPNWDSLEDGSKDYNVYYTTVNEASEVKNAIAAKTQNSSTDGQSLSVTITNEVGTGESNDDIIIPNNTPKEKTPEIILDFKQLSATAEIVIRDEKHPRDAQEAITGAIEYPGEVIVIVPEGTTADQVKILTNKSTVTVRGEYGTVIASCAPQTIIVEKGTEIKTLEVLKGNVKLAGKVESIVNKTADELADKDVVLVYMLDGCEWTNKSTEEGEAKKIIAKYPFAQVGEECYLTLQDAFNAAAAGKDIELLDNNTESPAYAAELMMSGDITMSAESPLTVTFAPTAKTSSVDKDGMAYFRSSANNTFTIGENVTLKFPANAVAHGAMYLGYSSTTPAQMVINGKLEAYLPYIGSLSKMTVNPTGSLTSVSENLIVRWGGSLEVDGSDAVWSIENPQVKLAYASQQGGIVTFKNTFVNAGEWWSMWNRNSKTDYETKLVLDNSVFAAKAFKGESATVPTYSVVLKNGSQMNISGTFALVSGGFVEVEPGSVIAAKSFSNEGKIKVDLSNVEGTEYKVLDYTGTASMSLTDFGKVKVTGGIAEVRENDLWVVKCEVKRGYDSSFSPKSPTVTSHDDMMSKLSSGEPVVLGSGEWSSYGTQSALWNKTLVIEGQGAVGDNASVWVIGSENMVGGEGGSDYSMEGANVTFKNVRIQDRLTNSNYRGFVRTANMTFENCVFTARESYWGVGNVTFKNCTFEDTGDWNLWCYSGKNFSFINCEFKSSKKGNINLYQENGNHTCDVYIENCSFTLNSETTIDKPAVQVGEDYAETNIFSVEFSDATINGNYAVGSFQNYPKYILNKNNKSEAKLRIIIDDVKIYGN